MPNPLSPLAQEEKQKTKTARSSGVLSWVRKAFELVGILAPKSAIFSDPDLPGILAQISAMEQSISLLRKLEQEISVLTEAANGIVNPSFAELMVPRNWMKQHLTKKFEHKLADQMKSIEEELSQAASLTADHVPKEEFARLRASMDKSLGLVRNFLEALHNVDRHPNVESYESLVNKMRKKLDAIYLEGSEAAKALSIKNMSRAKLEREKQEKEDAENLLNADEMPMGVKLAVTFGREYLQSVSGAHQGISTEIGNLEGHLAELHDKEAWARKNPLERAQMELEKAQALQKKAQESLQGARERTKETDRAKRMAEIEYKHASEEYENVANNAPKEDEKEVEKEPEGESLDSVLTELGKAIMEDFSQKDSKVLAERKETALMKQMQAETAVNAALAVLSEAQVSASVSEEILRQKTEAHANAQAEMDHAVEIDEANALKTFRKRIVLAVASILIGIGAYYANRPEEPEEAEIPNEAGNESPAPAAPAVIEKSPEAPANPTAQASAESRPEDEAKPEQAAPRPPELTQNVANVPEKQTVERLSEDVSKILFPYEIRDLGLYSKAVAETMLEDKEFSQKLAAAKDTRARKDLISEVLFSIPELKRKREMMATISQLMMSTKLAVPFKPMLYVEIFDEVEKAGWWSLSDDEREAILYETLMQRDPREKWKTKQEIIEEMVLLIRATKKK